MTSFSSATRRSAALRLLCALGLFSALSAAAPWAAAQGIEIKTSDSSTEVSRFKVEPSAGVGVNANAYFLNVKLGIWTATPGARLSLYDGNESTTLTNFTQALTSAGIHLTTDYTASAYTPGLFWSTTNDNPTKPKAGIWLLEDGSGTDLLFGTSNSYVTGITNTGLALDQSGRVGIGTTAPDTLLHVSAGSTSLLHLQSTTGGAGNTAAIDFTTFGGTGLVARIAAQDEDTFNGSLRFYTDGDGVNNSNVTEKMRISPAGGVYLGNSDVYFTNTGHNHTGVGNTAGYAAIENATNYSALMLLGRSGGLGGVRSVSVWDRFDMNGLYVCWGNGTTTSAIIMDINGSYWADWAAGWDGALATWDVCCSGVRHSILQARSDRRLKKNIAPLGGALDRLRRLRPVSFEWKDPRVEGGRHFGFIAQEVEEVIPDLVRGKGEETRSLALEQITPFLVKGTQELNATLREERRERQAMEARLEALEKALELSPAGGSRQEQ